MLQLVPTQQAETNAQQAGRQASPAEARAQLSRLMQLVCADLGADRYLLVEPAAERGPKGLRILACNWIYDALEELGGDGIFAIVESDYAAGAGEALRALPEAAPFLSTAQRLVLREYGHDQLFVRRLCVRGRCIIALL
jgi:hypothetical protein